MLGTHGILAPVPRPPDFRKGVIPITAFWRSGTGEPTNGSETLIDAFPAVLRRVPNARLIIAGANHHTKPGYWESIHASLGPDSRVEFRGYVPEDDIPELFRTSTIVVMPYDSATGSSGPAHQACDYGVPIVCADLSDFRDMAADEDMAIDFYKVGDAVDLADKLVAILQSPEQQRQMSRA